jgi:hypothetical protein
MWCAAVDGEWGHPSNQTARAQSDCCGTDAHPTVAVIEKSVREKKEEKKGKE